MLISGKEAKLAWANDIDVEYMTLNEWELLGGSTPLSIFNRHDVKFRTNPRTISINSIEVPAPFKPKEGNDVWFLDDDSEVGYTCFAKYEKDIRFYFGCWRTEDEIIKVVEALRSVFK